MQSVVVGALSVTLAPLTEIRAEASRLAQEARGLKASASKHRADAVARLVEAGMILVAREKEWLPANPAATFQLGAAKAAIARIDELGGMADDAGSRARFQLFRKKEAESPEAAAERERRGAELRVVLADLGRGYGAALAAVRTTHDRAMDMDARAAADLAQAEGLQQRADLLATEADNRDRAVTELGFDAPLTAATLQESGAPAVKSPLELRPREVAYLAEPAELARDKGYAINASAAPGLTVPLGVTGIPFHMGTHRGQAIPRDSLSMLGPGLFVVTNQRLGFVGKLKSFSFPITDLVKVEQYPDGLSLLRDGRANADVVVGAGASRILFYINWVLAHPPGT